MRPKIRRCRVLFFIMTLAAVPVFGQNRCTMRDTIQECLDRYQLKPADFMKEEQKALQNQPTGIDTGGASLTTGTKDFSPLMALAALLGQGTSDGSGNLVFDHNFYLPLPFDKSNGANNTQVKTVVNTQPEISGALRAKLHEKGLDAQTTQVERKIEALDDVTVQFSYNITTSSTGRGFEQYREKFWNMYNLAYEEWELEAEGWVKATQKEMRASVDPEASLDLEMPFEKMPPKMAADMLVKTEDRARQLASTERAAALASYYKLLDNQPQLHLTAEGKFRDPLVGPDEYKVKLTYEMSFVNLNAATRKCTDDWKSVDCLDAYTAYVHGEENRVGQEEMTKEMERGDRISFTGEYVDVDGDSIDAGIPELGRVDLAPVHKLTLKVDLSRKVSFSEGGEPFKLNLAASYEDVSDDPLRQDRGIASLTLTRRIGTMEIPFGIVYANHGEFLGDVDARLSAHLGLNFKMPDRSGS